MDKSIKVFSRWRNFSTFQWFQGGSMSKMIILNIHPYGRIGVPNKFSRSLTDQHAS